MLSLLLGLDLLLINLLFVDNVGSLNTLRDIGDSFFFRALGFLFSRLDLTLNLGDHNLGLGDLLLRGDLLLGGLLNNFLGGGDLSSNNSQFTSESLNIG